MNFKCLFGANKPFNKHFNTLKTKEITQLFAKILILLKKNLFLKTQVRDTEHKTQTQDTNTGKI